MQIPEFKPQSGKCLRFGLFVLSVNKLIIYADKLNSALIECFDAICRAVQAADPPPAQSGKLQFEC